MYLNFWKKRKDIDLTLSPPASVSRYKGHVVNEAGTFSSPGSSGNDEHQQPERQQNAARQKPCLMDVKQVRASVQVAPKHC